MMPHVTLHLNPVEKKQHLLEIRRLFMQRVSKLSEPLTKSQLKQIRIDLTHHSAAYELIWRKSPHVFCKMTSLRTTQPQIEMISRMLDVSIQTYMGELSSRQADVCVFSGVHANYGRPISKDT